MSDHWKNRKIIFLALIGLSFFVLFLLRHGRNENGKIKLNVDGNVFQVEVVSNEKDLERGLGGRDDLCLSCGMLFKFEKPQKYSFWMKNMKFPIDILWIYRGRIVYFEKNVAPSFAGVLTPSQVADSVLEINAGRSDQLKLEIGDQISF